MTYSYSGNRVNAKIQFKKGKKPQIQLTKKKNLIQGPEQSDIKITKAL